MIATVSQVPLSSESSSRIGFLSRILSFACLVGIVGLPLAVVGHWIFADSGSLLVSDLADIGAHDPRILGSVDPWQRLAGTVLDLIPTGFTIMALIHVRRCFQSFRHGIYFEGHVASALRGFAGMSALSVALGVVLHAPLSAVVSFNNPPGQRFVEIGLSSHEVYALFIAATVWLIAAVMAKAVGIAHENAEFV